MTARLRFAARVGVNCGWLFAPIGVAFVLVSTLAPISRTTWTLLHDVQGYALVGACAWAGFQATRACGRPLFGVLSGAVAGFLGALAEITAQGLMAFSFTGSLVQYPFEHYDFLSSGAPTLSEYLFSAKGIHDYTWTAQVSLLVAPLIGAVSGAVGALASKARPATRRSEPLPRVG